MHEQEQHVIQALGLQPWAEPGGTIRPEAAYKGFGMDLFAACEILRHTGFLENLSWKETNLRRVWVNPSTGSILTYCEGDWFLLQYNEETRYDAWWAAEAFYLHERYAS